MKHKVTRLVEIPMPHDILEFSEFINAMAGWLEDREPVPDHWEPAKRDAFYEGVALHLTPDAKLMIAKLNTQYSRQGGKKR